jgi:hypothetical protein
VALVMQVVS